MNTSATSEAERVKVRPNQTCAVVAALLLSACGASEATGTPGQPPANASNASNAPVDKASADQPNLFGITAPDPFPDGCVSCHISRGGDEDHRLSSVAKLPNHPAMDNLVTVPDDCRSCHQAQNPKAGELAGVIHKRHYDAPERNHFIAVFQGACLSCHRFDSNSGRISVKSGKRNW